MFCDRCGNPVSASAAECPKCRTPLAAVALVPSAQPRGAGGWTAAGWNAVTGNFWVFVLLGVVYLLAASAVPILVQGPVAMGLQWAALKEVSGRRAEAGDLGFGFNLFPQAVMVCLSTTLIISAGLVLLIIPGLVAAVLLQFPYLLVLDRKTDFVSALRESYEVSKRHFGELSLLFLIETGLILGGLLLCGVGLVVALPIIYAATAAAYVDLFGLRQDTQSAMAGAPRL